MSSFPDQASPHEESRKHEFLDELRFALRVVLALFSFITLILLLTEQHMALVSGVAMAVLFGLFILVDLAERRTRPRDLSRLHGPPIDEAQDRIVESARSPGPSGESTPAEAAPSGLSREPSASAETAASELSRKAQIGRDAEKTALRTGLQLAAGLGIIAIGLAALLLGWRMLGMGVLLFFAYLALFGAPYWIAAVHQRGDEARERAQH